MKKLLVLCLVCLLPSCVIIKQSNIHVHPAINSQNDINVHIQGSEAADSLNGNEGKVDIPMLPIMPTPPSGNTSGKKKIQTTYKKGDEERTIIVETE